jgi:hypothetical protein
MYEDDDEDGEKWRAIAVAELPANALAYLQSIYRNLSEPDGRRMRAAMAALPFESPNLTAMAIGSMNGETFAALLDKAIERSGRANIQHVDQSVDHHRSRSWRACAPS